MNEIHRDRAASKKGETGLGDNGGIGCAVYRVLHAEKGHELSWREKRRFRRVVRTVVLQLPFWDPGTSRENMLAYQKSEGNAQQ